MLLLASSQAYEVTLMSLKSLPSPAPHSLTMEILVYLPSWLITLLKKVIKLESLVV